MVSPTFKVVISGKASSPVLDPPNSVRQQGSTLNVLVGCRGCPKTALVDPGSDVNQPPAPQWFQGIATDLEELFVLEFDTEAEGQEWLQDNRPALVGKQIYFVDDTLASSP